jgi:MFS superfamily sulfate permease-like transporter
MNPLFQNVIFGTLFSYLFQFKENWKIPTVGSVKPGIPPPELPSFSLVSEILGDSISLAIVSFAINISMAKMFAKKYKYEISPNQVFN